MRKRKRSSKIGGVNPAAPNADKNALGNFFDLVEGALPDEVRDALYEEYHYGDRDNENKSVDLHQYLSPVVTKSLLIAQRKHTLSVCLDQYVATRTEKTAKSGKIAFGYLQDFFKEDRELASIRRPEVNEFVKWLLAGEHNKDNKPITTTTVGRYLNCINAAFKHAIMENELDIKNVFSGVKIPNAGKDAQERLPFDLVQLKSLHRAVDKWVALKGWDQLRCIVTVLAETGCRLAEVAGLASADVYLDTATPYIDLKAHTWRSLKNESSIRKVPLTVRAIEAIKAAQALSKGSPQLFPQYTTAEECNMNSVSQALNKWIRNRDGLRDSGLTCHCLRHSMKDGLRAVECPDSVQDRILGHTTHGVGAGYGKGYSVDLLAKWVIRAMAPVRD